MSGNPHRGESLIDDIDDERWQAHTLMWLARHAKPGEYADRLPVLAAMARDRLRSATDAEARTDLICAIAEQDPHHAADLARRAFDEQDVYRVYALAAIALAARDKSLARRLLAEALRLENFVPAVAVIAMIEPHALHAAAADISHVQRYGPAEI